MRDLRVESRFKNAVLYNELERRFAATAAKIIRRQGPLPLLKVASLEMGVCYSTIGGLLNLNISPYGVRGKPSKPALALSEYLEIPVEVLFPPSLYALKLPRVVAREFESEQVLSLQEAAGAGLLPPIDPDSGRWELSRDLGAALQTLSPREEKVVRLRHGIGCPEHSLSKIAGEMGVSRERIHQIEAKALRKLRHPSRSRALVPHLAELG